MVRMKKKILILFLFAFLFSISGFSAQTSESDDSQKLVALVDKAAALVEKKGKEAFPDLKKKDGEWFKGEQYVFVDSMEGIILVNPPNPAIEGQDLLKDAAAKTVFELLLDTAKTKGSGWVEYMWPKPGESTPSKKKSYIRKVKMPDGTMVIVGSGMYAE
jgi:cytochrome c